jgi:ABC-type glycerol-3-phosphate transport system substrate-binding protein
LRNRDRADLLRSVVRRSRTLVTALLVMLIAAACSSKPATKQTTLLRVLMTDDWVTPPFVDAVRSFERDHPDVRVVVERGPIRQMPDAVRAGISSGAPPDVVQGHAFAAAAQGLAQPLDDLWAAKLKTEEFFPGAIEDVTWAGRLYGVPLDTNALVLMYNAAKFRAAGLPEPGPSMTFADFENVARALTSPDGLSRGLAIPTSIWWDYGWIKANGGETVDVDAQGQPHLSLDAPPVVSAVSFLAGLINKGYAYPPRAAETHTGDALALFGTGTAAMYASGSWDLVGIRKAVPDGDFRVTLMPRGLTGATQGTAMGGSSMFVPVKSQHRELSFEFMTHLVADDTALRFAKEEGRLPVRLRVFDDPFFESRDLKVFLEQLKTAHPPKLEAFSGPVDEFTAAMDDILRENGPDPAATLRQAQLRALARQGPP